jgi:hypothetical protein
LSSGSQPDDATTSHDLVRTLGNMGVVLRDRPVEALADFDRVRDVLKAAKALNPTLILFDDHIRPSGMIRVGRNDNGWSALDAHNAWEIDDHHVTRFQQGCLPLGILL